MSQGFSSGFGCCRDSARPFQHKAPVCPPCCAEELAPYLQLDGVLQGLSELLYGTMGVRLYGGGGGEAAGGWGPHVVRLTVWAEPQPQPQPHPSPPQHQEQQLLLGRQQGSTMEDVGAPPPLLPVGTVFLDPGGSYGTRQLTFPLPVSVAHKTGDGAAEGTDVPTAAPPLAAGGGAGQLEVAAAADFSQLPAVAVGMSWDWRLGAAPGGCARGGSGVTGSWVCHLEWCRAELDSLLACYPGGSRGVEVRCFPASIH